MTLPAYPWSQRPEDYPLTADEVCAALAECGGFINRASVRLKVGSLVLRKFVERSARARAVIQEMNDLRCDRAADLLDQALNDEDHRRQDWAIRYVLNSKNARKLGWTSVEDSADLANVRNQVLINLTPQAIQWEDGTVIKPKEAARQIIDLTASPPRSPTIDGD